MPASNLLASASPPKRGFLNLDLFQGIPPSRVQTGVTDYELESIPRAIYNDPVQDMLLREEGFSGRSHKEVMAFLSPLKPAHTGINPIITKFTSAGYLHEYKAAPSMIERPHMQCSLQSSKNIMANAEMEGDTRTVVITDSSIEIINPHMQTHIRPFNKPKYRSPLDRPVYSEGRHKALPPSFPSNVRFSSACNRLAVTSPQSIASSKKRCLGMERAMKESIKPHVLRYNRNFQPMDSTCIARGLSFRGRGELDIRKGWATVAEVEADNQGDIANVGGEISGKSSALFSAEKFKRHTIDRQSKLDLHLETSNTFRCPSTLPAELPNASAGKPTAKLQDTRVDCLSDAPLRAPEERSWPVPPSTTDNTTIPATAIQTAVISNLSVDLTCETSVQLEKLPLLPTKSIDQIDDKNKLGDEDNSAHASLVDHPLAVDTSHTPISIVVDVNTSTSISSHDSENHHDRAPSEEIDQAKEDAWIQEQKRKLFGDRGYPSEEAATGNATTTLPLTMAVTSNSRPNSVSKRNEARPRGSTASGSPLKETTKERDSISKKDSYTDVQISGTVDYQPRSRLNELCKAQDSITAVYVTKSMSPTYPVVSPVVVSVYQPISPPQSTTSAAAADDIQVKSAVVVLPSDSSLEVSSKPDTGPKKVSQESVGDFGNHAEVVINSPNPASLRHSDSDSMITKSPSVIYAAEKGSQEISAEHSNTTADLPKQEENHMPPSESMHSVPSIVVTIPLTTSTASSPEHGQEIANSATSHQSAPLPKGQGWDRKSTDSASINEPERASSATAASSKIKSSSTSQLSDLYPVERGSVVVKEKKRGIAASLSKGINKLKHLGDHKIKDRSKSDRSIEVVREAEPHDLHVPGLIDPPNTGKQIEITTEIAVGSETSSKLEASSNVQQSTQQAPASPSPSIILSAHHTSTVCTTMEVEHVVNPQPQPSPLNSSSLQNDQPNLSDQEHRQPPCKEDRVVSSAVTMEIEATNSSAVVASNRSSQLDVGHKLEGNSASDATSLKEPTSTTLIVPQTVTSTPTDKPVTHEPAIALEPAGSMRDLSRSSSQSKDIAGDHTIKPSEKSHHKDFSLSIMRGLKKSTDNLSHKFGNRRSIAPQGSTNALDKPSTYSQDNLRTSATTPNYAAPPSEVADEIKYDTAPVKMTLKSGKYFNAMQIQTLQSGNERKEEDTPAYHANGSTPPTQAVVKDLGPTTQQEDTTCIKQIETTPATHAENGTLVSIEKPLHHDRISQISPIPETTPPVSVQISVLDPNGGLQSQVLSEPSQDASQGNPASLQSHKDFTASKETITTASTPHLSHPVVSGIAHSTQSPEDYLRATIKSACKGAKCDLSVHDFELHCTEAGKTKLFKPYYPIELRRILSIKHSDQVVTLDLCNTREGGKAGGKLKKIAFEMESSDIANRWSNELQELVFGGLPTLAMARSILILVEKSDKEAGKLVDKYMKEVIEISKRPLEIKTVQYNEFSIANVLTSVDFKKLGNIVCTNPEFIPRIQQLLVRERYCSNPVVLELEADPVDAALGIVRSALGKSNINALHVSGTFFKREEGKLGGFLSKFK
ncbi:hypothetical protein BASA60_008544 [Batrachochytrium salamandrivorans]|nr:hypothetical protein BASA60_008544 [Batrachochytrium salamandrivorans]